MHIAINGYFWDKPFTGSGQYTQQLVHGLRRYVSDLEITIIIPHFGDTIAPEQTPPDVRLHFVEARAGYLGKVQFEQQLFPRASAEVGSDLAHVPYWGGPLRCPIPLVITVHDLTTLLVPEYRRGLAPRLYTSLVSASARGADHIITDSFSSKLDIVDHLQIGEEDITAIYLAAGEQFKPSDNDLLDMAVLRKYDLPEFYVLYLGGYVLHKNINTLLLAYTYVAQALGEDYPLLLAGRKPAEVNAHFPDYDDYIRRLNLGKFVRWVGPIEEEDKAILYRNAESFVYPSRHEGFGLPPLEAMACGTPVVATDCDSLPEVVGAAAFTVDPDDARAMAGAIIATILQDDLRQQLRQDGLQQAARFTWQKTATETALVYDRVVNNSTG